MNAVYHCLSSPTTFTGDISSNTDIRVLALRSFEGILPDYDHRCGFVCADAFIADFVYRHQLSSQSYYYKRRPS
jgi:hypothetical protein